MPRPSFSVDHWNNTWWGVLKFLFMYFYNSGYLIPRPTFFPQCETFTHSSFFPYILCACTGRIFIFTIFLPSLLLAFLLWVLFQLVMKHLSSFTYDKVRGLNSIVFWSHSLGHLTDVSATGCTQILKHCTLFCEHFHLHPPLEFMPAMWSVCLSLCSFNFVFIFKIDQCKYAHSDPRL